MNLKPLVFALTSLALAAGCDEAKDQQEKANAAQAKANGAISEAARDADAKMKTAQAEADKKIAEAQAAFMTLREDYRHENTENLVMLDKRIAELEAKALTAKGKDKVELDGRCAQLRASRDAYVADSKSIETASAVTWDATKARLDKQWADLKTLADKA